ncbi:MAG: ABC transporter permease [Spirochaetales bacterium]|nr:ABC transporter permease [Spirochaetales bacterium]
MRTLFIIMSNFMKLTFSKKINYLLFIVAPVASFLLMTVIFGTAMTGGLSIGYINKDNGRIGADLIAHLGKTEKNRIIPVPEDRLDSSIIDGNTVMSLLIPGNFSDELENDRKPVIYLYSLKGEAAAGFIQNEINYFIDSVLKLKEITGTDSGLFTVMYKDFLTTETALKIREVNDTGTSKTAGSIGFGFFLYIILMQASVITGLMLKEKQNRTFYRIQVAPVREIFYSLGNMLAAFIILCAQIITTLFIIVFLLNINLGVSVLTVLPLLLAFTITAIGFGIMITSFAGSTIQSALFSNVIISTTSMLGGCFWPLSFMPDFLQYAAGVFPQSWTMRALQNLQNGASLASSGFTILLLLAFGALFIAVYAYKMKYSRGVKTIT